MTIVSDDTNSFTEPPAIGSRRVSAFIALPVIFACAVIGSVLGVTHPLTALFPGENRAESSPDPSLASIKPADEDPTAARQAAAAASPVQPQPATGAAQPVLATSIVQPEPVAVPAQPEPPAEESSPAPADLASRPAAVVSTGSVDRPLSPGVSDGAASTTPDAPQIAASETAARAAAHNHRAARAKRLRRVIWRRESGKPVTSEFEFLLAPIFAKK